MSLRVWLPLNGTLDNQGLDQVIVTNNGATINNSGKIGKCYSFDGNDDYISLTGNCLYNIIKGGTNSFSISFWIYQVDSTRAIIFGDYGLAGGIGFNIELTTSHCIRFYWNGSPDLGISQINVGTTTWNHVALVYDATHLYGYLNGNLAYTYTGTLTVKNKTSGSYYLGRDSRTGGTALNGKINDFRIYDHALSLMEVKQISQGLILHYPLNNNGWGQENLLAGTNQIFTSGNEFNRTLDLAPIFDSYGLVPYTISFDLKSTDISNRNIIMVYCQNGSGTRHSILQNYINNITTEFKRYSIIVTPFLEKQNLTQSYLAFYGNYNTGNKPVVKNIKVELGQKATPWCPNEADELYDKLRLNEDIQYDTSGYCNNGAKTGTFTYDSDTPKYNVSMIFDKASYINIGQQLFNARDEITVNLWVKADSWATNPGTFFSSMESGGNGWQKKSDHNYTVSCGTGASSNSYISTSITTTSLDASKWHMMTFTYDGMVLKTYIDTILQTTTSKYDTKTPLYYNSRSTMFIGGEATTNKNTPANSSKYPNFKGKISDVRIYCTALSAEDILSLYNNSAYIDNQGNIYGAMYEEV